MGSSWVHAAVMLAAHGFPPRWFRNYKTRLLGNLMAVKKIGIWLEHSFKHLYPTLGRSGYALATEAWHHGPQILWRGHQWWHKDLAAHSRLTPFAKTCSFSWWTCLIPLAGGITMQQHLQYWKVSSPAGLMVMKGWEHPQRDLPCTTSPPPAASVLAAPTVPHHWDCWGSASAPSGSFGCFLCTAWCQHADVLWKPR